MARPLLRPRIKVCGMTRAGDVRLASELGADAVGFIFAEGSPRHIHAREARLFRNALAPLADPVAVFRDNAPGAVREVLKQVPPNPLTFHGAEDDPYCRAIGVPYATATCLDKARDDYAVAPQCRCPVRAAVQQVRPTLLQFHGDEDDAFCRGFGVPYVKAIGMGNALVDDAVALQVRFPGAAAFLFDSHGDGVDGGSGRAFDWSRIPAGLVKPVILAGGLDSGNVFDAIVRTLPWGVDVSSGAEASPCTEEHTYELQSLMRTS